MKKWTAIVLVLCLALSITACATEKDNTSDASITEAVTTTSTEMTVQQPTDESSNKNPVETTYAITDWSIDDVAKNITLNGKKISLPCALKDLGDGYSWEEDIENTPYSTNDGKIHTMSLLYNGNKCGIIGIFISNDNKININSAVISLGGTNYFNSDLTFGEFKINELKENIIKTYGEPNKYSQKVHMYYFTGGNNILVVYNDDNKAELIQIRNFNN